MNEIVFIKWRKVFRLAFSPSSYHCPNNTDGLYGLANMQNILFKNNKNLFNNIHSDELQALFLLTTSDKPWWREYPRLDIKLF